MVLSGVPGKKSPVTPPGIDPGTVRLVAQHLNHYATPGPTFTECTFHFSSVAGVLGVHTMNTSHDGPIAETLHRRVVKAETLT